MRYLKIPPTAVNTRGDSIRTTHTTRKATKHSPLMTRSSMPRRMNDQVKRTCTIGSSISPTKFRHTNGATLAIRCVSPLFTPCHTGERDMDQTVTG
ncbi:MAG: hypothetical protein C5S49_01245 [Candidatus Methanogaster sp.]|nr:MAG: hypothetical protein C5S49_01245 [ANME-2 cluster archaeon]